MNVAICQLNFSVGDLTLNTQKIIEQIEIHKNQGIDLVVFPELAISGTPLYDLIYESNFVDRCYSALSDIADVSKGISVLVGVPTTSGEDIFNSVAYIKNGVVEEIFSKAMLSSRDEAPYFAGVDSVYFYENEEDEEQNEEALPSYKIKVAGQTALVVVGEDLNFVLDSDDNEYDLIIQMAARSYSHGTIEEDLELIGSIAKDSGVPVITCNAVGASTDIVHYGASAMFNPKGSRVIKMKNFEEDVQIAATSQKSILAYKPIRISPSSPSSKLRHDFKAITLGLKDYFVKSNLKTASLGLSGGLDSAVVLALAVESLGADNVRCYMMPSQFSSDHSIEDSIKIAKNFNVKCDKVTVEPIYSQFLSTVKEITGETEFSLAEENLQSRIRGMILMYMSNKYGDIVLNTTNKSEASMGYGTLYGDTNGALSILGDMYKTEVYDLAEYINRNGELIPRSIIEKAPSAELRPDQKDSDSLPEYNTLDKILYQLIEERLSIMEIASEGYDIDTVTFVSDKLKQNEHKRYQLAPTIRVSKRVLGKDRIMPIVQK